MKNYVLIAFVSSLIFSCKTEVQKADTIYYNGEIITMENEDARPETVAVHDGRISHVGTWDELQDYIGDSTELKDLEGKTLLPGFIDGHSHITLAMKTIRWVDLSAPPVGDVTSIDELLKALQDHVTARDIKDGEWINGWGYDPDQLVEKRHPSREELSAVFPDHPIFLLHVSGHMAVVNDRALELAGITNETPNPSNGVIVREQDSKNPNGLLQEAALYLMIPLLPEPSPSDLVLIYKETETLYARHGITTAQDGLTDYPLYLFLKQLAVKDELKIDIESLAGYKDADKYYENETFGESLNGLHLAGMKIVSDGSPQGKTAFFREPYLTEVPGCAHTAMSDCRGFPTVPAERLEELMATNYKEGIQTYVHANGDGSIEMLLDTHRKIVDSLRLPISGQRTVVIHSQFVGLDQLSRYKAYGFIPSFFTNHAFFWGDVHRENLGDTRANFLSPMNTSREMGIIATNHTDYTITPIDQLFLTWTAVNRLTRSGEVLGPEECIRPYDALKAITINSAYQHQVEDEKGSIEVGKLADFVVLDQNPLTIDKESIKDIRVIETIKEGVSIYKM